MNKVVAETFFVCSSKSWLKNSELPQTGWTKCMIHDGRHLPSELGCCGSMQFIKLTDGRIIVTNDLWYIDWCWTSSVPTGSLIGFSLKTRVCHIRSLHSLNVILDLMDVVHTNCRLRSGLTDREAYTYSMIPDRHSRNFDLPECTPRKYQTDGLFTSFHSPEGACLTHFKIGNNPLQPLNSKEQLEGLDPTNVSIYILYHNGGRGNYLQKGDEISNYYVYDMPGW